MSLPPRQEKDMVSTGCSSDMANATRIAEALIKQCGYSKVIGETCFQFYNTILSIGTPPAPNYSKYGQ